MLELSKKDGEDLLHLACKNGQVTLIKNLLNAKLDINAMSAQELSPLRWAVIKGNLEVTQLLIREGANIELKDSRCQSSPLLFACQNGRLKIVKYLIEMGADIQAASEDGTAAVHFAAQSGNIDVVDFLLQKGLDINSKNNKGESPLYFALYPRHFPACQKAKNALGMVTFLIKNGANIFEVSSMKIPIAHAITRGNLDVIKLLISHGANLCHLTNNNYSTPLHYAINPNHNIEIIRFLINNGADVNAAHNNDKTTPLHVAADYFCNAKMYEILRILFESGANPKLRDFDGLTPFDYALEGNNQFVKMALEFYPNLIEDLDATRNFPIQYALQQNNLSAFKMINTHCQK